MEFPENIFYTIDHEWIQFVDGVAIVGITDFAQKELGDIVYVEIETLGSHIGHGEVFGTIEAVKTVSDLFMPVDGEILEINSEVMDSPELVNNKPYNNGWLIKIKPVNSEDRSYLLNKVEYLSHIGY